MSTTDVIGIVRRLHRSATRAQRTAQATLRDHDVATANRLANQAFIAECLASANLHPLTGRALPPSEWLPPAAAGTDPRRAWSGLLRPRED